MHKFQLEKRKLGDGRSIFRYFNDSYDELKVMRFPICGNYPHIVQHRMLVKL